MRRWFNLGMSALFVLVVAALVAGLLGFDWLTQLRHALLGL